MSSTILPFTAESAVVSECDLLRCLGFLVFMVLFEFYEPLAYRRYCGHTDCSESIVQGTPNPETFLDPLVLPQVSPHQAFPELSVVRSKKVEQFVNDDVISNLLLHA